MFAPEEYVADEAGKINFHFIKSASFRVIHVDGAHGGVTPNGHVQITLYSERAPIPQRTTHQVSGEGRLGEELPDRITRDGPVRECEVTAIMDLNTATALKKWLDDHINAIEKEMAKRGS